MSTATRRVERMNRRRTRRHVWTPDEVDAVLDGMRASVDRARAEDGLPPTLWVQPSDGSPEVPLVGAWFPVDQRTFDDLVREYGMVDGWAQP